MSPAPDPVAEHAARILAAMDSATSIPLFTDADPDFNLDRGYRVAAGLARLRLARGERPLGWKIGFTNRTIWEEYGVHAPIWGPLWDSTVTAVDPARAVVCPLASLVEPRIEPEIAFRIARTPEPGMSEDQLLECIDAVAHGFEIVQSLYPGWRFQAADTVAVGALHGRYFHGPLVPLADRADWRARLAEFEIGLFRDGQPVDRGHAVNVLDGPLSALRHFVRGLADCPVEFGLRAGDLVTTGTVTRAFPVAAGERWHSVIVGLPLPGLSIAFA